MGCFQSLRLHCGEHLCAFTFKLTGTDISVGVTVMKTCNSVDTQNFIITNELHPGNPLIFFDFREKQQTFYMGQWVLFFSLTSTEGTEKWFLKCKFNYSHCHPPPPPFFFIQHRHWKQLCSCFSLMFSDFCLSHGPKMIQKLLRFSNYFSPLLFSRSWFHRLTLLGS